MIVSINPDKIFDEIHQVFMKKTEEDRKETYFNIINGICSKPTTGTTRISTRDYMSIEQKVE